jgi:hypothetical protein
MRETGYITQDATAAAAGMSLKSAPPAGLLPRIRRRGFERYFFALTNTAVTLRATSMGTVQLDAVPLSAHAPPQPTNVERPTGVAVSVTVVVPDCANS